MINRDAMTFELREAAVHIADFCRELERGEYDDNEIMVLRHRFDEVLAHLCRAWHRRSMSDDEIDAMTQDQYDAMSRSVPDWSLEARLVDIETLPGDLQ